MGIEQQGNVAQKQTIAADGDLNTVRTGPQPEQPEHTTGKRTKNTILRRYIIASKEDDFNAARFSGTIAYEQVAKAKTAIRNIATPFLSKEMKLLVCSDKGLLVIEQELTAAIEAMVSELTVGARSSVKVSGYLDVS